MNQYPPTSDSPRSVTGDESSHHPRKFSQTITLRVEYWATGETHDQDQTPQFWEWSRLTGTGGDFYDAQVLEAGPVERVDRHDYWLQFQVDRSWVVYDAEGDELWRPRFVGSHADAVAWIAAQGGTLVRR